MCALCPPFVANNLQFLALKIVKGAYGQIPNQYSYDLKSLIKSMLNTDSSRRPNINKILTSKVISKRISNFLTESKRMDEFSHTIIHNKNIF
jgi:NIMA (never in mitosis gene a)-related kinase